MKISENIIQITNHKLNSTSQPHITYAGNEKIDTACLEWILPLPDYKSNYIPNADKLLYDIRELLANYPVFVYKGGLAWLDITEVMSTCIVIAPVTDQFEVLRLEKIEAANYGLDTENIIEKLKDVDERYGIDVIGASYGAVEFLLRKIPTGPDAQELGEWLLDFWPDACFAVKNQRPHRRISASSAIQSYCTRPVCRATAEMN